MDKYFSSEALTDLDLILNQIETQATDNDELILKLSKHRASFTGDSSMWLDMDPLSDQYLNFISAVHEEIIGKAHQLEDEGLPELNPDHEHDWPYPWGTRSSETVARFLISYGILIKTAALPPHARILEVGCGVGSLTWNLARMGYRVDAIDPNELQCKIVQNATKSFPIPPKVVAVSLDQWFQSKVEPYKYDAIIFFESFHHILNHKSSLRVLIENHLEDDGRILLAAEPIFSEVTDVLPYPWGPRLDGESMRAMRRWAWLELGFTRDYLKRLFTDLGLTFKWVQCKEAQPLSQVVVGTKRTAKKKPIADKIRYPANLDDGIQLSRTGMPSFLLSATGLGGAEPWGRWTIAERVVLKFTEKLPSSFLLVIELADVFGPNVHKNLIVHAGHNVLEEPLQEIGKKRTYQFNFEEVDASELTFIIPHPCRPKDIISLGNEDARRIGIAIVSLAVKKYYSE